MNPARIRCSKMAEEIRNTEMGSAAAATATASASTSASATTKSSSLWPSVLRWIPTSTDHIIAAEKRLLSLVKTPYVQEKVDIGSGPPGSKIRWFRSKSNESRFINTVTFDAKEGSPTLVMVHGYGASQGFFFRNFDALAKRFRVIAIDQLGWGGSSRPDFTCKSTEETETWFIDSFEEWRKAKNLSNFILLGHSFGGYVAAKYALKHPEHVQHLILVGPAGFSSDSDPKYETLTRFRATWKGAILNHLWESNFTPMKVVRGLGPWGPNIVRKYTSARFGTYATGDTLTEDESRLLTDYVYHTLAAKGSGELCLKYIFSFGAFTRMPLLNSASEWKVPTTFIYGFQDWMNYEGAMEARKQMKVPCEIIRVPQQPLGIPYSYLQIHHFREKAMASEQACTLACLILHDDGIPITSEKIATLVKAANVNVESYWPSLFAKLAEKRNIEDLILNAGSAGGGAAVAVAAPAAGGGGGAAAAAPPPEEKKEEPKEESDDDMGFSLFD